MKLLTGEVSRSFCLPIISTKSTILLHLGAAPKVTCLIKPCINMTSVTIYSSNSRLRIGAEIYSVRNFADVSLSMNRMKNGKPIEYSLKSDNKGLPPFITRDSVLCLYEIVFPRKLKR